MSEGERRRGDDSTEPDAPKPSFFATPTVDVPSESRSLFCATLGPVERGTGDQSGIALNLPDSQGALLVAQGIATPGVFYAGIGASCDLLPGFTYSGVWVDHVGHVVPGVTVYPYYVAS